ncbi:MAG: hypothetical protein RIT81_16880 [Deltaproteobacteria bacterium]
MTNGSDLEAALRTPELYPELHDATHPEPERLAEALTTSSFTEAERAHLAACAECRAVVAAALRAEPSNVVSLASRRKRLTAITLTALGAAAAVALVLQDGATPSYQGTKGSAVELEASVSLLVTDAGGRTRVVFDGGQLGTDERLGFRYGDPAGHHATLTIVGYDGQRVHWYYPERSGDTGFPVEAGARSVRMKEDIELDDHRPGMLRVAVAFDAAPVEVAEALAAGRTPKGATVFRLNLREAP